MGKLKGIKEQTKETVANDHHIVAIGASAGGLEAIHDFFDHMPPNSDLSFVIIQHLSSDYKSLLVELVSKHTHMQVFEAKNNMPLQRQCVYVIPNNKVMTVQNGMLQLADKSDLKAPNAAIDIFLHSLARDKKDKAIAIILSGTGSDGTRGIHSITEQGGIVIVQDPVTAKFDGMPHSAIATGKADSILPPEQMPDEIYAMLKETPSATSVLMTPFELNGPSTAIIKDPIKYLFNCKSSEAGTGSVFRVSNSLKIAVIALLVCLALISLEIISEPSNVKVSREDEIL